MKMKTVRQDLGLWQLTEGEAVGLEKRDWLHKRLRSMIAAALGMAAAIFGVVPALADNGFYTDRQMMVATQIAYYDFSQEQLDARGGSATVRELLQDGSVRQKLQDKLDQAETDLRKKMAQNSLDLYQEILADGSPYGDWRVADVKDENKAAGFYGILLETDPQHAIIAFRGSESTDYNQFLKDWINADFGLLMDKNTVQQNLAAEFLAEINRRFSYSQYAVTGHSLGGNLAEHAAITAPDDMRLQLSQVVSFDGPGYSEEYMLRNKELIDKVKYPIVHYRWSMVGALLTQPSCVQSRMVEVTDDVRNILDKENNFLRHSTAFLRFDGEQLVDGTEDVVSSQIGEWSRLADQKAIELRRKRSGAGPGGF